jgi:hypothetical protein
MCQIFRGNRLWRWQFTVISAITFFRSAQLTSLNNAIYGGVLPPLELNEIRISDSFDFLFPKGFNDLWFLDGLSGLAASVDQFLPSPIYVRESMQPGRHTRRRQVNVMEGVFLVDSKYLIRLRCRLISAQKIIFRRVLAAHTDNKELLVCTSNKWSTDGLTIAPAPYQSCLVGGWLRRCHTAPNMNVYWISGVPNSTSIDAAVLTGTTLHILLTFSLQTVHENFVSRLQEAADTK